MIALRLLCSCNDYLLAVLDLCRCVGSPAVVESRGCSQLSCVAFSLGWLLSLWSTGSRALGLQQLWCTSSVAVVHGPSCCVACGILPNQGSNLCLLHCCCSVTKSCPTLPPHELQHARPPCPSPSPGVWSNSCPLSQ